MGYVVLLVLFVVSWFLLGKLKASTGLTTKQLYLGWGVKLCFSLGYSFVFMHFYGSGEPDLDLFNFFNDSRAICRYGQDDLLGYIKLMFGFQPEDKAFIANELSATYIWEHPPYGDSVNDNRLLIRINSVFHFISFNNVYVHIFLMTAISWIGLLMIYVQFKRYTENPKLLFALLIGFPSLGFWTSGLTKEALMCLALGFYFTALFKLLSKPTFGAIVLMVVALGMLIFNKPHVGLLLVGCSSVFIVGKYLLWKKWLIWMWPVLLVLGGIAFSFTPETINLVSRTTQKQTDLINMAGGGVFFINDTAFVSIGYEQHSHFKQHDKYTVEVLKSVEGEYKLFGDYQYHPIRIEPDSVLYDLYLIQVPAQSFIPLTKISHSGIQLVKIIPEALLNVFVRPFPWDPGSKLKYPAALSNVLLILLLTYVLAKSKRILPEQTYLVVVLVSAALLIALIIGWTTPILGSAVRYKCAVDLLLILTISILWPQKKADSPNS